MLYNVGDIYWALMSIDRQGTRIVPNLIRVEIGMVNDEVIWIHEVGNKESGWLLSYEQVNKKLRNLKV